MPFDASFSVPCPFEKVVEYSARWRALTRIVDGTDEAQNKFVELMSVLLGITQRDAIVKEEWNCTAGEHWNANDDNDSDEYHCICSKKHIRRLCIIEHVPSGIRFIVGSVCVNHFAPELYKKIMNGTCVVCDAVLESMVPGYARYHKCCSEACKEKSLHRQCQDCGEHKIDLAAPATVMACSWCTLQRAFRKHDQATKEKKKKRRRLRRLRDIRGDTDDDEEEALGTRRAKKRLCM